MNTASESQKRKALAEISQTWADVGPIDNKLNTNESSSKSSTPNKNTLTRKQKRRQRLSELHECVPSENLTPVIAEIAALDYKFNGARARVLDGEFVGPRWVIDLEVQECEACRAEFNWVNRRK